jgi:uncharacterized protein (TIGR03437 family)
LSIALLGAHLAPAQSAPTQNVALLTVQAGNGQVACECLNSSLQTFQPISVKATDSKGNPVSGATVTWTVTGGQMTLGANQAATLTTTTGSDGTSTTSISLVVIDDFTTGETSFLVNTVQASSNNNNVFFTETQSLLTSTGNAAIEVSGGPTYNGGDLSQATLSAPVTTILSTPIVVRVAGLELASGGVGNVAVHIINSQTSPTLTCSGGNAYADPGSVLTLANGNASCFPQFNGSGTGTFYITVGGPPAANIGSALFLQSFGPYTFTSIAGAPAAMQIVSGDYQIGTGLNPLVARVVDSNGYAVQNQAVTWAVTPAGAAALTNEQTVSDNNGEVSLDVSLFLPAASGALITVTLQSNTAIYAVFQETLAGHITGVTKVSGDTQSAQPGTNFPYPLVVQVNGTSGPVANYPLQFLTSGPVSLPGGTTVYTNANGQVSLTAKAGATTGTATVTAVAGTYNVAFTLTVSSTPSVTPNGLSIVSGNPQSAMLNTSFPSPLVVQVNSTNGAVPGYVVSFSGSGPISISSGAATTGSNGQAQITVQAGGTAGAATVTASIPGYTVTFNLTVVPAGPVLTANSFLNAASRVVGSISPCGLAIISAQGLTPDGNSDLSLAPVFGRLPLTVHGLSVTFGGYSAPIVSVAMGAVNPEVTLQVPCEVTPGSSVPVTVNVNGGGNSSINIPVQAVSPGIFQTTMSDGVLRAVVVRDDGTFADVGGTPLNPARRGEKIRIYATGLGSTAPFVDTDNIQDPNADLIGFDATVSDVLQVGIVNYGGLQIVSQRQAPDLIGVYEVQVQLPNDAPTGNSVQIAVAAVPPGASSAVSSIAALIPIQ